MKRFLVNPPAEPFFLKAGSGERFCIYRAPTAHKVGRGAIIYVHPFCEEMNKARRMAALQARAFAGMGFGVLQIDLFGCGDSSGEFGDARWEIWKEDLAIARKWLAGRINAPVSFWGLRLGALLALDFARDSGDRVENFILWQPVISGEAFLTQFLRLRLANEMLASGKKKGRGAAELRNALAMGEELEVAGYKLSPSLVSAIDNLNASELTMPGHAVHWFEVVPELGRPTPPAAARVAGAWKKDGVNLHIHLVPCTPFWATQEISECPELLTATARVLAEG